jgi:hypothetical protein
MCGPSLVHWNERRLPLPARWLATTVAGRAMVTTIRNCGPSLAGAMPAVTASCMGKVCAGAWCVRCSAGSGRRSRYRLRHCTFEGFIAWLRYVARHVRMERFRRSRRGPKKPQIKQPMDKDNLQFHVSIKRPLDQDKTFWFPMFTGLVLKYRKADSSKEADKYTGSAGMELGI